MAHHTLAAEPLVFSVQIGTPIMTVVRAQSAAPKPLRWLIVSAFHLVLGAFHLVLDDVKKEAVARTVKSVFDWISNLFN